MNQSIHSLLKIHVLLNYMYWFTYISGIIKRVLGCSKNINNWGIVCHSPSDNCQAQAPTPAPAGPELAFFYSNKKWLYILFRLLSRRIDLHLFKTPPIWIEKPLELEESIHNYLKVPLKKNWSTIISRSFREKSIHNHFKTLWGTIDP